MEYGTIFDIKQFAVFDGPGIRQTVFFKGCPLHCSWCHNPEGQNSKPEMMVSFASCTKCGKCKKKCKHPDKCILCGECIDSCPLHLRHIAGERISSDELVKRLKKDSAFYQIAKGGVTFSGGEPLMQPAFLMEVLDKCQDMHRAIETSGYIEPEAYREIYSKLDLIIQDFKIFDEGMHIKHIGKSNRWILENIAYLTRGVKPFIIRIPLIPGVTDTEDNLGAIASFLKGSKTLERVELLPYVTVAGAKYQMVQREYKPDFDPNQKPNIDTTAFSAVGIRSMIL